MDIALPADLHTTPAPPACRRRRRHRDLDDRPYNDASDDDDDDGSMNTTAAAAADILRSRRALNSSPSDFRGADFSRPFMRSRRPSLLIYYSVVRFRAFGSRDDLPIVLVGFFFVL